MSKPATSAPAIASRFVQNNADEIRESVTRLFGSKDARKIPLLARRTCCWWKSHVQYSIIQDL